MEILAHKGKIVLADNWQTSFSRPEQTRCFWPTDLSEKDYGFLIGLTADAMAPGVYRCCPGPRPMFINLANGSHTQACWSEIRPVPQPKGKTRWANGRWVK